jgi:N-acetylneuraminic acid mutarotase
VDPSIYYAPLQKTSIAGDLDLLGLNGANLGDSTGNTSTGSIGGSIYAGNIFSAGALEVSGNTQLWNGLGVEGPVNIGVGASSSPTGSAFSVTGNTSLTGISNTFFTILNNGNVGIGPSTPVGSLNISSGNLIVNPGGNVGIGFSSPVSLLQVQGDGSTGSWQTNTNFLPNAANDHTSIVANGYVYVMGGDGTGHLASAQSTIYYAKLNFDGSTASWQTSYLPNINHVFSSVVSNGYVYVIGGHDNSSAQSTVYYAKLNADGSIGSWQTNSRSLPAGTYGNTSVIANGYVYVIGGNNGSQNLSSVYYAKLNSDGSTGSWNTNTKSLPSNLRYLSSVIANGYVYIYGGQVSSVYYAKLNSDGSVNTWQTNSNSLPIATQLASSVVSNGYVYVLGGGDGGSSRHSAVYYAKLNSDGSTGTWNTNSNYLPILTEGNSSVIANGYIYVIGGAGSSVSYSSVYYASLQRVSIQGDLDLLGLSGANIGDSTGDSSQGSVGGSIYAGNIFSAGALEISGNTQLWNGLGVNGPVNIGTGTSAGSSAFNASPVLVNIEQGNPSIGTGYSAPEALLNIAGDGQTGKWRTNSNSLPQEREGATSIVANGYIYVIGGYNNFLHSTVYYSKLNSDGSAGTWKLSSSGLPARIYLHSSVVANGYVYALGGWNGSVNQSSVYYSKLNADGSTGPWQTNTYSLPAGNARMGVIVSNGYMYQLGGDANYTVYSAKINADGSVGNWATANTNTTLQQYVSYVAGNGYVYAIGGYDGANYLSSIYYSKINSDGTLGSWSTNANSLPDKRSLATSIVSNGYIYVIGGGNTSITAARSTVFFAKINSDGSLGTWNTNSNFLPGVRTMHSSVIANSYIYVLGGQHAGGGAVYESTVYYAPLSRVSIAADLDLLGFAGANIGDSTGDSSQGSVGGSIYAGNIFSAGALEISGNTQLWNGLGVNGPVNIGTGTSAGSSAFNASPVLVNIEQGNPTIGAGYSAPEALLNIAGDGQTGKWRTNSNNLPSKIDN